MNDLSKMLDMLLISEIESEMAVAIIEASIDFGILRINFGNQPVHISRVSQLIRKSSVEVQCHICFNLI